jgi:hypothetical protein
VPVLGRLWQRVRSQAHQLVLFYVNRQAAQATKAQYELLAALQALAVESARQREAIAQLEQTLAVRADSTNDREQ